MSDLTEAQVNFIDWLGEGSGECVMDRYGRFVSHGEVKGNGYAMTILRLIALGYVEGCGPCRFKLTGKGNRSVTTRGNPTHSDQYAAHGLREEDFE